MRGSRCSRAEVYSDTAARYSMVAASVSCSRAVAARSRVNSAWTTRSLPAKLDQIGMVIWTPTSWMGYQLPSPKKSKASRWALRWLV